MSLITTIQNKKKTFILLVSLFVITAKIFGQPNSWQKQQTLGNSISLRVYAPSFTIGLKAYVGPAGITKEFWEYDQQTDTWTQKADLPTALQQAASFSIGNKGYLTTGSENFTISKSVYEYDPANNLWSKKGDFGGVGRYDAIGFAINGRGYIGAGVGGSGEKLQDVWEYNPTTDSWTRKLDFPFGRSKMAGFVIGLKAYFGTGEGSPNNSFNKDFYEYDPAINTWTRKADFIGAGRNGAAGFTIGQKGYLGTGWPDRKDFYEYDPLTDSWTAKADLGGRSRYGAFAFSIGNKGYIGEGANSQSHTGDFWEFDATNNLWQQRSNLGGLGRLNAISFVIGNKAYIGTGQNGDILKDLWEYDMNINSWTRKANLGIAERRYAASFSMAGFGYVGTGSVRGSGESKDFWRYDPTTDSWSQIADFGGPRRFGAVAFTVGGKGYVGTGSAIIPPLISQTTVKDIWEYDPTSNSWIQKNDYAGGAVSSAASFTIGNKAYVTTGLGTGSTQLWEYDHTTDQWTRKVDFPGEARQEAVGFSTQGIGYIGTGFASFASTQPYRKNDLWGYDPSTNSWNRKTDMPLGPRSSAIGFALGDYGYVGFGQLETLNYSHMAQNDLWRYTPGSSFFLDSDHDGYGDNSIKQDAFTTPSGYVLDNTDCNDNLAAINPGASELCNGIDDNCDGQIDENCPSKALININDVSVAEGQTAQLTVTLSKMVNADIQISYKTAKGTASAGKDFVAVTKGVLTIPAGSQTGNASISTLTDNKVEPDEYFDVQISVNRNSPAAINDGIGRVTILGVATAAPDVEAQRSKSIPEPPARNFSVSVLQNPNSNYFTLQTVGNINQILKLKVVDNLGRVIEKRTINSNSNSIYLGANYAKGIYYVEISHGLEKTTIRLIKQ